MSGLRDHCVLAMVIVAVLLVSVAEMARADDVRPVQVLFRELPSGDFEVQLSVPKLIPANAMPSPKLPAGSTPTGSRTLTGTSSAWQTRQVYRCPDGLAGQVIGLDYPLYNLGFSTILRVELLSGERYTHMLDPGMDHWQVPADGEDGLPRRLQEARAALVVGARHFFHGWVHVVVLLTFCLLGRVGGALRLAGAFLAAQLTGVLLGSLLGLVLEAPLAEMGVALAAVLLARQALQAPAERAQLVVLACCAGVAHGLGIAGLAAPSGEAADPGLLPRVLFAWGMDAVLVIGALLLSSLGVLLAARVRPALARTTAYVLGGVAVAIAIDALVSAAPAVAEAPERRLRLPDLLASVGGTVLPGSRRVASSTPDAVIQAYVSVEAFEVRCEILVRLRAVAPLVGVDAGVELPIEGQAQVARRVRDLVFARAALEIDGERPAPTRERVDFMTLDAQGALPRPAPVAERIESAWVGVSAVYATPTTARDVSLTWQFLDAAAGVPATVIDPESSRSVLLTQAEPILRWKNELVEDPVPQVSAVAVEPRRVSLPLWSLLCLIAAGGFGLLALRRRRPVFTFAAARLWVALAVLLGPLGILTFAAPGAATSAPTSGEARRLLVRLLPNVYRALEFRAESAVFDRLALSVEGEALHEVYLQQRKGLEMEERGGAQSRVEAVDVLAAEDVEGLDGGGFVTRARWTVAGTVTHFGHRHFRQNRYDALVTVVPVEGTWKLRSVEVLDEERIR